MGEIERYVRPLGDVRKILTGEAGQLIEVSR